MKIIAISDLHGDLIKPEALSAGDVLAIAGDVLPDDYRPPERDVAKTSRSMRQGWWFDEFYVPWLKLLIESKRWGRILWIGGNHDFFLDAMRLSSNIHDSMPEGVVYLNEEMITIDGKLFYGVPWNCTKGWAFALDEKEHAERLKYIPPGVDVFICHGPPGIATIEELTFFCSPVLGEWVREAKPRVVICGHVHESYGEYKAWETQIFVVSSKDRNYRLVNKPVEIEL